MYINVPSTCMCCAGTCGVILEVLAIYRTIVMVPLCSTCVDDACGEEHKNIIQAEALVGKLLCLSLGLA